MNRMHIVLHYTALLRLLASYSPGAAVLCIACLFILFSLVLPRCNCNALTLATARFKDKIYREKEIEREKENERERVREAEQIKEKKMLKEMIIEKEENVLPKDKEVATGKMTVKMKIKEMELLVMTLVVFIPRVGLIKGQVLELLI